MADNMAFEGFRPLKTRDGSAMPHPMRLRVASGYSGSEAAATIDLRVGDIVRRLATGYVAHADAGSDIFGIVVGTEPHYDGQRMVPMDHIPAGTTYPVDEYETHVLVLPASGIIFEADCDDNVTATTRAQYIALLGENCDHIWVPTAPRGYPRIDISTHGTGTAGWRLLEISPSVANADLSGNFVKLLVTVNETQESPYVTTGI